MHRPSSDPPSLPRMINRMSIECAPLDHFESDSTTVSGISGATFTLINRCDFIVWPGILSNSGSSSLESTGFVLGSGSSRVLHSSASWSGRFWGRTGCSFDPATGRGSCLTGDCGSGQVECNGNGARPPATLAEFTVGSTSASGQDFYDVSLVDGYNLPIMVDTNGGSGLGLSTGCNADLDRGCPAELRTESGGGCKSACEAFGSPEYCCSGAYASPDTCKPSVYSQMFKTACPKSYSYAYDDATSTFTCTGADYTVTFCPSTSPSKNIITGQTMPSTTGTTTPNGATTSSGNMQPSSDDDDTDPLFPWLPNFSTGDAALAVIDYGSIISSFIFLILFQH